MVVKMFSCFGSFFFLTNVNLKILQMLNFNSQLTWAIITNTVIWIPRLNTEWYQVRIEINIGDNTKLIDFQKCKAPFILHCNTSASSIYRLSQLKIAHCTKVKINVVPQCSICTDGNTTSSTHHKQ